LAAIVLKGKFNLHLARGDQRALARQLETTREYVRLAEASLLNFSTRDAGKLKSSFSEGLRTGDGKED
jgi:hypothetical protein